MPKAQVPCSVCGKPYSPTYIAQHERAQHRIYRRNRKAPTSREAPPQVHYGAIEVRSEPVNTEPRFRVVPMMVLENEADGSIWIAERIKD